MESFEKPDSNSSSAPTSGIPEISTEQLKKEIKLNYLPILSSYQKISIKTKDKKENDKIFDIEPDVNYIDGDSKKSYYVFYNNNLTGLREFYKYELDRLLDKHSIILYYLSDYLTKLDINIENQPFLMESMTNYLYYELFDICIDSFLDYLFLIF